MTPAKPLGLLAILLLTAAAACSSTVATNDGGGGSGGCHDTAFCAASCPKDGLPPEGGSCPVDGQACGQLDECGFGAQAVCTDGSWVINWYDPADECGCGIACPTPCPTTQPANGDACTFEGVTCPYTDPSCADAGAEATCSGGVWSVSQFGPSCLGLCPATLPATGTPCSGCCVATGCTYLDESGCPALLACENGFWAVSPSACTPVSACATFDMNECFNANGCRWMAHPGCPSVPQSFPQGCYPVADCASDADCLGGGHCQMVEADPCPGADCNACKTQATICVP